MVDNQDIVWVFTRMSTTSAMQHLSAFVVCEEGGGPYVVRRPARSLKPAGSVAPVGGAAVAKRERLIERRKEAPQAPLPVW